MKKRNKRKKIIIGIIVITLVVSAIFSLIYFGPFVIFKKEVELNSNINTRELASNVIFGNIIEDTIDTTKLGKQKVTVHTKSLLKKEKEYEIEITVTDTKSPIIDVEDTFKVEINEVDDLLSLLKVTDNSQEELDIKIEGKYDLKKLGEYKLQIIATDKNNNASKKNLLLQVSQK